MLIPLLFMAFPPVCQAGGMAVAQPQSQTPIYRGYPAQDALSYTVDLRVKSGGGYEGSIGYRFRALEDLDAIHLDSQTGADWKMHFFDEQGHALAVTKEDYSLTIPLRQSLRVGDEIRFSMTFSGEPSDGLYRNRNRYGDTFLYTDHFTARARGWMPCEDSNADRAHFEITLHVPAGWDAIGSGAWTELPSSKPGMLGKVFHGSTHSDIPPGLFTFAAGPFLRIPEEGDLRIQAHYVFPQDLEKASLALLHHAAWMQTMEKTFGPYQYAKFTTVQIPTRWGGMEYPGNVWLAQNIFDYPGNGVGTLAHEFVHMWFGDGVGYAQWEDAWLSEGFASYFGPWLYQQVGGVDFVSAMQESRRRWLSSQHAQNIPILWHDYGKPDDFFGRVAANTYQKGAWVLHMLRQEMGDKDFFAGLKLYYLENAGNAVRTSAFVSAMERVADRDLTWFFEQWLERPGAPELQLENRAGQIILMQIQQGETFRFKLRLAWTDANGLLQNKVFSIDQRQTVLPLGEGTKDWKLDPQTELLFLESR